MITLSDFQNYLSNKLPLQQLQQSAPSYLNDSAGDDQEQQLLTWAANLSAQTQMQQVMQLEQLLTELTVADLEDKRRLKLLSIVISAASRLITALHKHYNHELGELNAEQLLYSNQVKSLYYQMILAYDGIIQRASLALSDQQELPSTQGWKRLLTLAKMPPFTLAAAIYQALTLYQKLLYEQDLSYQPPSAHLWSAFNRLYFLACRAGVAHNDLSMQVVTRQALSIHKLYVQICLHSLLNIRALQRSNILLVQRLLPSWSIHVSATYEPQSATRLFVDLQSQSPPEYLSASSAINPYEEHRHCLFIDLKPLAEHLYQRQQALLDSRNEAVEYQLVNKVLLAIQHRYLDRQTTMPTRHSPKQRATVISGLNNIHYEVADKISLMTMIAAKELPAEQLPRYDTAPKNRVIDTLSVDTFDSTDTTSIFRALHLLPIEGAAAGQITADNKVAAPNTALIKSDHKENNANNDSDLEADADLDSSDEWVTDINMANSHTAPPPLTLMSLFLLCRSKSHSASSNDRSWSLGMVRWLNFEQSYTEVEWQILGHVITACGLRLDNRDERSQSFVPALMVAGDEALQTAFTIIVPPYHFKPNDKVMLRIDDKQERLRLQDCLINSKAFNQYKVMQL